MDPAGNSPFSGKATDSDGAAAATEGMVLPLTDGNAVKNNGQEAEDKSGEKGKNIGNPTGTKADDDRKNSNRKNQGFKQNHRGQQQEESASAGETKDSQQVIIKEIENLPLYIAALQGDWDAISNKDPQALASPITEKLETPLHVAIQTSRSISFIKKLVAKLPKESLLQKNRFGNTALHNAAIAGNAKAAKIMVEKNSELLKIRNNDDDTPLHCAAAYCHEEVVGFLLSETADVDPSTFEKEAGAELLNFLIIAGFYGYAFAVIKDLPELAHEKEKDGKRTPFTILAQKPEAFDSKRQLGFCQRILHYVLPGNSAHKDTNNPQGGDVENPVIRHSEQSRYRKCNRQLKGIGAVKLLRLLIDEVMKHPSEAKDLLASPLETAARLGNHVFIKMVIQKYPCLILHENTDGHNIFHISVIHCQEDVFDILFQMDSMKHFTTGKTDGNGNNMLHLAGMDRPSCKISGAALQMQREFQWFKEVEKIVQPSFKEAKNHEGKTPREVFTETHEDLVKEGEAWMKDVASSCSVVAALVVTVMFAAAFTVPGGNNDIGAPLFLDDATFLIFAVSVILGLFSSSISLLMFLGMLTSRYAEKDFLVKLPRRLVIGLVTLFISLAAMLVAFSASIHILLYSRISWILIPVGVLALTPMVLFGLMQYPLLFQMFKNTYMPTTIFHENPKERIF